MYKEYYNKWSDDEWTDYTDCSWTSRLYGIFAIAIIILLCVVFGGCKSIQYVPVPEYHYEIINKTDSFYLRDSLYCHDSIYVEKSGDTITTYKTKIIYRDRWRDKVVRDSIIKTDSIRVPYPVEKQLSKWQGFKMRFGGFSLVICFLGLLGLFLGALIKLKKWF